MRALPEDVRILIDLEPVVTEALDNHFRATVDWYPHQYIPWSQGRDYDGFLEGEPWDPSQQKLNPAARDGLLHNLLSEENLPSYHRVIGEMLSLDGPWGTWVNRWTLEEARHGTAIRDYLVVTRSADPIVLEDDRAQHVQHGYEIDYRGDLIASLVYVTVQELGTRVSYQGIRRLCDEPVCAALMQRIAHDENRHMLFYRTVLQACMRMHPDRTLQAVAKVLTTLRPPGHGAPGFGRLISSMARSGILSPETYCKDIAVPFVRMLGAVDATGLGPVGLRAQEDIAAHLEKAADRAGRYRALTERLGHLADA
ncbi:acyl-ACP desaturase [Streptomyces venezuelae]|uniref:Acyl-ACP desaturase n=1 Tax=Streptomyces venezuelae TaxID=54571 RepID=A0A5P2BR86_STRVZ|nr:acyl-ACP desaturase [Streptomyces venezuelae]QES30879.1 acyl-ACP desaturase [Streptomyces venezuelae]